MEEKVNNEVIDNSRYKSFVGISFANNARSYFFGIENDIELKEGEKVIVETVRGVELGEVVIAPIEISKFKLKLPLKPILRKAEKSDIALYEANLKDAVEALKICEEEVSKAKLDMRLIAAEYTLDRNKVIISYLADERVDFRELLKALAYRLKTRIELRQIGTRDKSKLIGGLGMCGLKLCCSTFLNEFDGISINRAKNQMLAINIPKLSGHCGKLMCCLKYEDDAYTELRSIYPNIGEEYFIDKKKYKISAINLIADSIKLDPVDEGEEDAFLSLDLETFKAQTARPERKEFNPKIKFKGNKRNNKDEEK